MKILVVEDEPLIRLGLTSLVEDCGYQTIEARNADEAIQLLDRNPTVRLVITDVDMPGSMDGIRLAHYVRQKWPPIHLIVISGKVGVTPGELPLGARFMAKPYHEPALVGLIDALLASGRPWDEGGRHLD